MIKKRIPEQYDISNIDIFEIINSVVGHNVEAELRGRVLVIFEDLSSSQLQQIKTDILSVVEVVSDL